MVRDGDPLVRRLGCFQDDVTADLMYLLILPATAQDVRKMRARDVAAGSSCDGQDFVADQVEANLWRSRAVKEERGCRFNHIPPQFVPRVALREDVLGQALGTIPAVSLLDNLEYQFCHTFIIRQLH